MACLTFIGAPPWNLPGATNQIGAGERNRFSAAIHVKQAAGANADGTALQYFGPIVPVIFNRSDLTQPETSAPVRGLTYITEVQPLSVRA